MPSRFRVFDAHCDSAVKRSLDDNKNQLRCSDMRAFSAYTQVYAVCSEYKNAFLFTNETLTRLLYSFKRHGILPVTMPRDLFSSHSCGIMAIEGADALHGSIAALHYFFKRGVRLLTLTWNNENDVASSICAQNDRGLKPFGRRVVRECEALGITVDLSHIGDRGFFEVLEMAQNKVVCSHSNSRTVCGDFKRNITDEQFCMLKACGGVVGINLCADFIGNTRDLDAVVAHIEHFCALGGEENIGLGSDFDGVWELPQGCGGALWYDTLFEELLKRNYSEKTVKNIAYNNFCKVFYENMKKGLA